MSDVFVLKLSVRDYECDLQGVVNNAVYQNYLEHARHEFLKKHGIDFAALSRAGTNLMVIRAELDYKGSLSSGDQFRVETRMQRQSKLKFLFIQEIFRENRQEDGQDGQKALLSAVITGTAVNAAGRPMVVEELAALLS